jgi:WD40 repeat protein
VVISDCRKAVSLDADARTVEARVFSLPDLKAGQTFRIPESDREKEIKSVCFSPDGKLLAVGVRGRPTPFLFPTDTFEAVLPFEGHGERIVDVFFSTGGKVVRTLAADNTICTWDVRTLKSPRRQSLPSGWEQRSAREPDGRYLIGTTDSKEQRTLSVFDVEADKVVTTVKVTRDWSPSIFWASDREVYALDDGELWHIDVISGKTLARRKFSTSIDRDAVLTEDGNGFLVVEGADDASPVVKVDRISVRTGEATSIGEVRLRRFFASMRGLVPGGKFWYLADPAFYLFDSKSMKLVTSRAFRDSDVFQLAFTRDGERCAVVSDPGTKTVVRVHETRTGRTLGAFLASTRWVSVKFSPDGKQLAVINDDGTFELWDLSPLDRS